jgi:hypothetical protein
LRILLERVREGFVRFDQGEIDEFELDRVIFHYKRSAAELWKFCGSGGAQTVRASGLAYMRERGEESDWCEAGALGERPSVIVERHRKGSDLKSGLAWTSSPEDAGWILLELFEQPGHRPWFDEVVEVEAAVAVAPVERPLGAVRVVLQASDLLAGPLATSALPRRSPFDDRHRFAPNSVFDPDLVGVLGR